MAPAQSGVRMSYRRYHVYCLPWCSIVLVDADYNCFTVQFGRRLYKKLHLLLSILFTSTQPYIFFASTAQGRGRSMDNSVLDILR